MYGIPSRRTIPKSTVSFIATVGCLSLALFLIAAMLVLALIPLYISEKNVSVNPDVLRSKETIMAMEVEGNSAVKHSRRRRRDSGDLSDITDGTFGDTGIDQVKTKLLSMIKSKIVHDIVILKIDVGYESSDLKKRRALSKRAAYSNNPIVIVIHFYIIYYPTCFYSCQLDINPTLRSTLYGIQLSTFVFTNVPIYKNGIFYKFTSRIGCIRVVYVSMIIPGLSPLTPTYLNVLVTLTSTTTTIIPFTTQYLEG